MPVSGAFFLPSARKISVRSTRKRDCVPHVRNCLYFVIVVVVVASGLTYTTIRGRTNHPQQDYIRLETGEKLVAGIATAAEAFGKDRSGETKMQEKDVARAFENIGNDVFFDTGNGRPDRRGHKDTDMASRLLPEAGQNNRVVAESGNRDLLPGVERPAESSNNIAAAAAVAKNGSTVNRVTVNATNLTDTFDCPESFRISDPDLSWFQNSIVQKSGKYVVPHDDGAVDEILILTPISNVKRHLRKYFENICSLTYPHRHISIALGEDSSTDDTLDAAEQLAAEVRPYFRRVQVLKLKGSSSRTSGQARHELSWQLTRRRHLAMARNQLLFAALRDQKWVVWTDSDVRHIPGDLLERLLWPGKTIVAPNCLYRMDGGRTDTFDRNTWRDTEASRRHLAGKSDDFLMLEGYEPTQRKTLNDLKGEGDVVRLDGVGGCALLVEGDLHRKGLVFPSFVFDHHVETEGLAKMAARMGIELFGLPSVNAIHW